jgi:pyruvate,water dikinase
VVPVSSKDRAQRRRSARQRRQQAADTLVDASGWLGKKALHSILERVTSFARMHEALRVSLARSQWLARQVALDAARRLVRMNPELNPRCVWQLSFDEVCDAVEYGSADLTLLVEERARARRQRLACPSPPRHLGELAGIAATPVFGRQLAGAAAAPGRFTGRVRHLGALDGGSPLSRDDVVVSPSFEGANSVYIGYSGAIVCGVGGTLSHAAFVAREQGVPAIVGLGQSINALGEGDLVTVDGDEGVLLACEPLTS